METVRSELRLLHLRCEKLNMIPPVRRLVPLLLAEHTATMTKNYETNATFAPEMVHSLIH